MDQSRSERSSPQSPDVALATGTAVREVPGIVSGFQPGREVALAILSPEVTQDLYDQVTDEIVDNSLQEVRRTHGKGSEDPKAFHSERHTRQMLQAYDAMFGVVKRILDPRGRNLYLRRQYSTGKVGIALHDVVVNNKVKNEGLLAERERNRGLGPEDNEGQSGDKVIQAFEEADDRLVKIHHSQPVSTELDRQTGKRLVDATLPGAFDGYTLLQGIQDDDPICVKLGVMADMAVTGMDPAVAIFMGMMERRELSVGIEDRLREIGGGIDYQTMNLKNPDAIRNLPPDQLAQIVTVFRNWMANPKGMEDHHFDQVGWAIGRKMRVLGLTDEEKKRLNVSLLFGATETKPNIEKIVVTQEMVGPDEHGNPRNNLSQAELDQLTRQLRQGLREECLNKYDETINMALERKRIALDLEQGTDQKILQMAYYLPDPTNPLPVTA